MSEGYSKFSSFMICQAWLLTVLQSTEREDEDVRESVQHIISPSCKSTDTWTAVYVKALCNVLSQHWSWSECCSAVRVLQEKWCISISGWMTGTCHQPANKGVCVSVYLATLSQDAISSPSAWSGICKRSSMLWYHGKMCADNLLIKGRTGSPTHLSFD